MTESEFVLGKAAVEDASAFAACLQDGFTTGQAPQVPFYARMFPPTASTHAFFAESFAEQMKREPRSHFVKVVECAAVTSDQKIVGFCKWTPPNSEESFWADYAPDMDAKLCDEFFGAMAEHREKLTAGKPHWYVEILGVAAHYQRKGIGKKMLAYGCALADADGLVAYVDSSPNGKGLYEKFGFESKAHATFSEPFSWYREDFMLRQPVSEEK